MPAKKTPAPAPSAKTVKRRAVIKPVDVTTALPEPEPKAKHPRKGLAPPFKKGHDPRRFVMVPRLQRITDMKRRVLAKSGMTPLDFLTAVYRDELYDDYEPTQIVGVADEKLLPFARVWKPTDSARRVKVNLDQRIAAANQAAPYFHSKRPVQLNLGNAGNVTPATLTPEQIKNLSEEEMDALIKAGEILGHLPTTGKEMVRVGAVSGTVEVVDADDERTVDMPS